MTESEFQEILPSNISKLSRNRHGRFDHDSEFWEFMLMLGFGNLSATEELYQTLRKEVSQGDWRMPLLEIGEARFLSLSGREFESYNRLSAASNLIFSQTDYPNESVRAEILALYNYVLSSLKGKFGEYASTLPLLYGGKSLTSNTNFKLALAYLIAVHQVRLLKYPVSHLISAVKDLEIKQLRVLACIGYRQAGVLSRLDKDYETSHQYYNSAMLIATKMNLTANTKQIQMGQGFAYYTQGKFDLAEETYSKIQLESKLDPLAPVLYENLALIAKHRNKTNQAVELVEKALAVATQLDSVARLPGECLFLGEIYEKHFGEPEKAEHYYKLGYDHAMRYAEHDINLTGDRKNIVDAYVRFIARQGKSKSGSRTGIGKNPFAFAQGKPWKEIKDIFQYQLILYHTQEIVNSKRLALKLNMPATTLYSLQDRLKNKGYLFRAKDKSPQTKKHDLHDFIEEHEELSWEEINRIFEREMMHYLYEKYGYNKIRMANVLELSYPSIINKTRELTQVDAHLLQN